MQIKRKFVYHYPTVNAPKRGITTVNVPKPVHKLKYTPVTLYTGDRMDDIAQKVSVFAKDILGMAKPKESRVGFRVGYCHACGQSLPEQRP